MKVLIKIAMPATVIIIGILATTVSQTATAADTLNLRLSAGSSFQVKNDVQIPNDDEGTRFSLFEAVGEGPVPAVRLEINWNFKPKHGIRVMLAPLAYTESTTFAEPVLFNGENFDASVPLEASYRFNSWRLGYHYTVRQSEAASFRVGATLKVRDAEIRLEQGDKVSFNDNIGFVPLLYLAGKYNLNNRWTIGADLDGLAGGPGRAIDLGITLDYAITDHWRIGADVRVLEGGADSDTVYNFAQLNSATVAISAGF